MQTVMPKNAELVPKDAKCVFKGVIYDVYQWQQTLHDGSQRTFEMLKRPHTVKVIAVVDGTVLINKEKQPKYAEFYDIPGGRHDEEAETELEAAQRELLEETGMAFKTWKLLDASQPHAKIEQFVYVFLATDLISQVEPKLDAGEKIEVNLMDLKQVKGMLGQPNCRYLPRQIFNKVNSIKELVDLPEYTP